MLPNQLYTIDLEDLINMIEAYKLKQMREFDQEMINLAWQTSLLMNSTGRYKKFIKATDLYKSIFNNVENNSSPKVEKSKEELRSELRERFGLEG